MPDYISLEDEISSLRNNTFYMGGSKDEFPDLVQPFIGDINDLTCAHCLTEGHGVAQCSNTQDIIVGCPYHNELHKLEDCTAPLARTKESITYWYWTVRTGLPPIYESSISLDNYSDHKTRGPLKPPFTTQFQNLGRQDWARAPRDSAFKTYLAKPLPELFNHIMPDWLVDGKAWARLPQDTVPELGDFQIEFLKNWWDRGPRVITDICSSQMDAMVGQWGTAALLEWERAVVPRPEGKTTTEQLIEISDDESDGSSDEEWESSSQDSNVLSSDDESEESENEGSEQAAEEEQRPETETSSHTATLGSQSASAEPSDHFPQSPSPQTVMVTTIAQLRQQLELATQERDLLREMVNQHKRMWGAVDSLSKIVEKQESLQESTPYPRSNSILTTPGSHTELHEGAGGNEKGQEGGWDENWSNKRRRVEEPAPVEDGW